MNYEKSVKKYFARKSESYDLVDLQFYWQLSDKLLWDLFKSEALSKISSKFKFLDAGGGTGRWSQKVLQNFPKSEGVIYDLSKDMLAQAEKKKRHFNDRLILINGNLQEMQDIKNESFDITFNFHNVLGFVKKPNKALSEMVRVTKKGGYMVSVIPNIYHIIFFNLSTGNTKEAGNIIKKEKGRFTPDMPKIHVFNPGKIAKIYKKVGLKNIRVFGFPVTIYPGMEETQIKGSSDKIKTILGDKTSFKKVYAIERTLIAHQEAASRGNNLFVVGIKK